MADRPLLSHVFEQVALMQASVAVFFEMDQIEIVDPGSNVEDIFPPISGNMSFGKAKG